LDAISSGMGSDVLRSGGRGGWQRRQDGASASQCGAEYGRRARSRLAVPADHGRRRAGDSGWLPATVPGDVHLDLLANKKIPDPFFRDNEAKLQWMSW